MKEPTIITSFPGQAVEAYRRLHGKLPSECFYCSALHKEMRPYGPKGAYVCFDCAMATPERKAQTGQAFDAQLDAAGPVSVIGEETGPRPLDGGKQ